MAVLKHYFFKAFNLLTGRLAKNSLLYTGSNFLLAAIPFSILPVLTRYLTKEDYGTLAMFQLVVTLLIPIIGLSTNGAAAVKFYKLKEHEHANFVAACIVLIVLAFLAVLLLMQLGREQISRWTAIPVNWLWAPCAFVLCQVLIDLTLANWQVRHKSFRYGLFLILNTLINFSLSVLFVVLLHFDWTGRVLGQIAAAALFATLALLFLQHSRQSRFGSLKMHMLSAIRFGLPLLPNYLLASISLMIGRFLINSMIGTAETGLYSVAYQIASILVIIAASFNLAYSPWLYEKLREGVHEKKVKIVRLTYLYFVIAILAALGLGLSAPYTLPVVVGPRFVQADHYIIWFAIAFAFNGMHMMVVNYIFFAEKVVWVTLITIPVCVINLFLSYFLIKSKGGVGAAQAQAIAAGLSFLGMWFVSSRIHRMPWFHRDVFYRPNSAKAIAVPDMIQPLK